MRSVFLGSGTEPHPAVGHSRPFRQAGSHLLSSPINGVRPVRVTKLVSSASGDVGWRTQVGAIPGNGLAPSETRQWLRIDPTRPKVFTQAHAEGQTSKATCSVCSSVPASASSEFHGTRVGMGFSPAARLFAGGVRYGIAASRLGRRSHAAISSRLRRAPLYGATSRRRRMKSAMGRMSVSANVTLP